MLGLLESLVQSSGSMAARRFTELANCLPQRLMVSPDRALSGMYSPLDSRGV